MNSTDSLPEQVQTLRQQVSRLETSNSKILKLLNERESSEKLLEKKWTDVQNKIGTLEKNEEARDGEINVLRENVSHLKGRVEELSRIVQGAKLKHRSEQTERGKQDSDRKQTQDSNEPKITVHKLENSDDVRNGASSEALARRITLKLEANGTTVDEVSKQEDIRKVSSKRNSKEKETIPKAPIKANQLGLRGRTISFEVDNRVRLLQGVSIENGNLTPCRPTSSSKNEQSKEEEKWNLPTREELRQKKIEEAKKAEASSRPPSQRRSGTQNEYKNLAGVSKDPNAARGLVDIETWKNMADVQRLVGLGNKNPKQGVGPDTCLLLDTSGSMEGANFEEMITIAKTFIQGIAGFAVPPERSENIGIATFGEQTRVVQHLTNDFSKLLETLDLLSPAGPSPMSAGLYMALACCLGRGKNTSLVSVPVPFRIILISDGKGTPDIVSSGEDDFPVNLETTVMKHIWLNETITHFENRRGVVYCIGVGDTETEMMDELCKRTHGKMFKPEEVQKLIHMTNNTTTAIHLLDRNVDFENITELDKINLKLMGVRDVGEVVRLGEYYYEQSNEKKYFREFLDTNVPPVGARVRRGPDWKYENQDQNGPGTITAHAGLTSVWVVWDCENGNRYQCSPETATEVLVVDEPRALKDQLIAVGCLVVRGDDWRYDDEDGGVGNVGVVLDVRESGLIMVRWPNTFRRIYKYGCEGFFEVQLCDPKKVKGIVGQLKTHVWGSGNILEAPQDDGQEGATASITPSSWNSTESSGTKLKEHIIEDEEKPYPKYLHINSMKTEGHWTIEDMNKRNSQMRKAKTIESDQAERTATPARQMIVHWAYKKEDSWSEIPLEISSKMEKAYGRNKQGSIIVELEGNIWRANFSDMKIKCEKTRTITDIQRTCNETAE